ncbi:MAG: putative Ig domain-containing protein [Vicinamibacterales bacterium]
MKRRLSIVAAVLALGLVWTARSSTTDSLLVEQGAAWKYLDNGTNQGTAWRGVGFNDGAWLSGTAQFGYGDGDEATVVSYGGNSSNKFITTYFRRAFNVADPTLYQSLTLRLLRDDGAVAYLNGTEVFRTNLPGGAISHTTPATVAIGGAEESTFYSATLSPALLVIGTNVLAVEVHQANGTSSDVSFDADLVASTSLQISRGPYLQMGTPSSILVRWRTSGASDTRVLYGLDPASLIWSAGDATSTTEHQVTLSGLLPNTKYYYAVGSTTQTLAGADANHFFVTSPPAGTDRPTRVWVLGDSGTKDANARAVRDAYYGFNGSPYSDLWLMLGDNAYEQGLDSEYQAAVFDMYPATLRQSVLWPTLGNHDGAAANSSTGTGPYYDIFTLPKQAEAGGIPSGTEAYYSFDRGSIHFVSLESFETDRSGNGAMLTWLRNDLASTNQKWTIAFWHHPPYSKGSHDSDVDIEMREMRENALPILEDSGVDLVLTGHSHAYERSFLIDGHYGASSTFTATMKKDGGSGREDGTGAYNKLTAGPAPHEGAVYGVAGSSGKRSGGALNHPAMFVSLDVLGSMVLDVSGNRLDARFIDHTGAVRDYFTLEKGSAAPAAITTATLPDATAGSNYTSALTATGGVLPYAWGLATGQLPAGLGLTDSGVIGGLPAGPAGTSAFEVRVTGQDGLSSTRPLTLRVAAPLQITTGSLPGGSAGVAYAQTLAAAGGLVPYAWSVIAGSLPAGLTLNNATGVISGTPTTAETRLFTVRVTDAGSPQRTAERDLSIAIAGAALPGAFRKSAPKNAAKNVGLLPTLSWTASSGASSYEYCADTTNDSACAGSWLTTGSARQVPIGGLSRNTTYYWQVRSRNAGGTAPADGGTWWKFTTAR